MKTEIQLLKTDLKNIYNHMFMEVLFFEAWVSTGNKFEITFNGSKGYFNHLSINCEGVQRANNILYEKDMFNNSGSIKKKVINVFYSEKNGVRISLGADKPRVV